MAKRALPRAVAAFLFGAFDCFLRKVAKSAKATKRTVASAKPKRAPVKKAAPKVQQPVAPVVETVAAEVIEQPVAVTEVEETRKAS